jgi:hypothetical protein
MLASLWPRLRDWWRTDTLLSLPLTAEVIILFDAEMGWTAHENKVELTPAQVQQYCAGLFAATQAIAEKHGVEMRFEEEADH